jgi:Kef-type K+ transport system membrane component KefB
MPASVTPMTGDDLLHFLTSIAALLLVARSLGWLVGRIGLPSIVGELLTGVLLGPSLLGIFPAGREQMHLIDAVGQFGLLLLVALTGAHLDLRSIRAHGHRALTVSLGGLLLPLVSGIALGFAVADVLAAGGSGSAAVFPLFMGVAMCVSAIPVISKTLIDMKMIHRDVGQLAIVAAMVDDAAGWILLSVVSGVATTGIAVGAHVSTLVVSTLAFALFAVAGVPAVRLLLRHVVGRAPDGSVTALAVVLVLGAAATTHALGLEAIFGAFVAGLVLNATGSRVREQLTPLRAVTLSVLAPIFLATAGLRMDLTALAEPTILLIGLAVLGVAVAGKFVGAYLGARLSKLSHWEGLALGAGMNSRGVVEVVVAVTGLKTGLIGAAGYTVIVLVAITTSVMAPPLLRFAMSHLRETEEERRRALEHSKWDVQH